MIDTAYCSLPLSAPAHQAAMFTEETLSLTRSNDRNAILPWRWPRFWAEDRRISQRKRETSRWLEHHR